MCPRSLSGPSLILACTLFLPAAASFAQQPATTAQGPPRLGYYTRVQSQSAAASPTAGSRLRARNDDPFRPYGSDSPTDARTPARPYERAPLNSPPEREAPAPAVSHNFFPGARPGQGSNRNVAHCVPGRHSLMHR